MTKFPYAIVVLSAALAACADKGATDTADTVADSVDTVDTVDTVDSETSDTVTADIAQPQHAIGRLRHRYRIGQENDRRL